MNFKEDQEVQRVLVVSTIHVTKEDMDKLDGDGFGFDVTTEAVSASSVVAYKYEFGSFVVVSVDIPEKEQAEAIKKDGYSPTFLALYSAARAAGFDMIKLDCDGPVYEDLPKFDW